MSNKKKFFEQAGDITPSEHFHIATYTDPAGTSAHSITGMAFQPDFIWTFPRNASTATSRRLVDSVRGTTKEIYSDLTAAQATDAAGVTSFNSDGYTIGGNWGNSYGGFNFVSYSWKAGGTAVSNTDGSITSQVSANTDAGFSIIKYTGDGNSSSTFGHGLNQTPDLYIHKDINNDGNDPLWGVYHVPTDKKLFLNLTNAGADGTSGGNNGILGTNKATSTTLGFGAGSSSVNNVNSSGADYLVYAFHNVDGYQKIDSYNGSGSSQTINVGFQPRFVIIKRATGGNSNSWVVSDSVRGAGINVFANLSNGTESDESAFGPTAFTSNGFSVAQAGGNTNVNGSTYIYLAIA